MDDPPPTGTDPPDTAAHHRSFAGDRLTHYARDVILAHLLDDRPIPMHPEDDPVDTDADP